MFAVPFKPACWLIAAAFLLLVAPSRARAEGTQAGFQEAAAKINQKGSDDDIDEATSNGMKALMNLAVLNIPGAFSKGYEAYGNYINSTKLDDLEAKTKALKSTMASAGSGGLSGVSSAGAAITAESNSGVSGLVFSKKITATSLRTGNASIIADEFEKRTGMSRDELVKHFNSAVDSQLSYQDPDLMSKLEQRFHAFRDRVPNEEFRKGLDNAEAMFQASQKLVGVANLMGFYVGSVKGENPLAMLPGGVIAPIALKAATQPAIEKITEAPKSQEAQTANGSVASATAALAPQETRAPASVAAKTTPYADEAGVYLGLNAGTDTLKDFIKSANADSDSTTIFQQVSTRYRKLMPRIMGI